MCLLLDALVILRDQVAAGTQEGYGICQSVENIMRDRLRATTLEEQATPKLLKTAFAAWPEFSGVANYPVRSYDEGMTESYRFYAWYRVPNEGEHGNHDNHAASLWGEHDYGRARRRLLDFLIDFFNEVCER